MKDSPRTVDSNERRYSIDEEKDMDMSATTSNKPQKLSSFSCISTSPNTPMISKLQSERRPIVQARVLNDFLSKKDQAVDEEAQIELLNNSDLIFQKPECQPAWIYGSIIFRSDSPGALMQNLWNTLERNFPDTTLEMDAATFTINCKKMYREVDRPKDRSEEIFIDFDIRIYTLPENLLVMDAEGGQKYYNMLIKKNAGDMFLFMSFSVEIVDCLKKHFIREGY
jgi:hypothetical protein